MSMFANVSNIRIVDIFSDVMAGVDYALLGEWFKLMTKCEDTHVDLIGNALL